MNKEMSATEKAKTFVEMWGSKPAMVMGNASNLLTSARAFLFGLKWATAFHDPDAEAFRHFLESFDRRLSKHLTGNDDGVSWFDALLDLHDGDQSRAFQEFIQILEEIAKREGFLAPD